MWLSPIFCWLSPAQNRTRLDLMVQMQLNFKEIREDVIGFGARSFTANLLNKTNLIWYIHRCDIALILVNIGISNGLAPTRHPAVSGTDVRLAIRETSGTNSSMISMNIKGSSHLIQNDFKGWLFTGPQLRIIGSLWGEPPVIVGFHRWPGKSPHWRPVKWQAFPWHDVIKKTFCCQISRIFIESLFNSSPTGQNGCHLADDTFRCIFVNGKFCVLIEISLKIVP